MMERIKFVDIAKGIAIILVVVGHYQPVDAPAYYQTFVDFLYTFHMPVFMAMSGFLFFRGFRKTGSYRSFVAKKFRRLMIPYFVFSLFITSVKLIAQQFITVENPVEWSAYLKIFILPEAAHFLWFIYTLFLIFLIVPLFLKYLKNGIWVVTLIAIAIFFIPDSMIPGYFCLGYFRTMLFYFVFGAIVSKNVTGNSIKISTSWILPLIVLHLACFCLSTMVDLGGLYRINQLLMGISGCLATILLASLIKDIRLAKTLTHIGLTSSAIYLFHTMSMAPVKYVWFKCIGIHSPITFLSSIIVISLVGIIIPICIKKIINKNKTLSRIVLGE